MRYHPSRSFVLSMALFLAPVPFGVWAWAKASSARADRPDLSFLDALRYEAPAKAPEFSAEQLAEGRRIAQAQRVRMLAMFPDLAVPPRPVADEENGFLQLHLIAERFGNGTLPGVPGELQDITSPFDVVAAREHLGHHSEWVETAGNIAALTRSSDSAMPESFEGFVEARCGKSAADHLLLKARLLAEEGDEKGALHFVELARSLAGHYRGVEHPGLIGETVAILIDLSALSAVLDGILPALGSSADLAEWRTVLASRDYSAKDLARVVRGEWYWSIGLMAPYLVHPDTAPPDPDHLIEVFTEDFSVEARRLEGSSLETLVPSSGFPVPASRHAVSKKGREILEMSFLGSRAWYRGWGRVAVIQARGEAVLELLQREQNGEDLSMVRASKTRNPLTNDPFVFDPATREFPAPKSPEGWVLSVDSQALPW